MDVIAFSKDVKGYLKTIEKKAFKRVKRLEKMAKKNLKKGPKGWKLLSKTVEMV